jgi:hypothetical protein
MGFIVSRLLGLTILIAVLIEFSQRLTCNRQVAIVGRLSEEAQTKVEKIGSEDSGLWIRTLHSFLVAQDQSIVYRANISHCLFIKHIE